MMKVCVILLIFLFFVNSINYGKSKKRSFYRDFDIQKNFNPALILNYDYLTEPLSESPITSTSFDINIAVPQHKLHACVIGKNFSNMLWSVFCYLYNSKIFQSRHKSLRDNYWSKNICSKSIVESSFKKTAIKFNKKRIIRFGREWKHIMIVRHPVDRFISAFTHFCLKKPNELNNNKVCFTCGSDMKCLLNNIYYKMELYIKTNQKSNNALIYNFFPQTWQCQYSDYKKFYTILQYNSSNLEPFYENFISILEKQGISEGIVTYINNEIRNTTSLHPKKHYDNINYYKKELYNDPYLLRMISIVYYNDFKEFNFDLPLPKIKI
ncbi:Sulfotransferase family-containing protein [Strongyloides ratti]|uniref:Sulfotransferase family-containing protein n=1 Tax=Strongyloides ratti TaxID=34506 RepID=A0A090LGS4_STRRB|nr:Sulfotransferase family-containing protein [Strongyloides ratti]CEF68982.1 Sulfotransferase family-containing protein [Strongyloides ratti]